MKDSRNRKVTVHVDADIPSMLAGGVLGGVIGTAAVYVLMMLMK